MKTGEKKTLPALLMSVSPFAPLRGANLAYQVPLLIT